MMKAYTMADWQRDGSLRLQKGQLVSNEVVTELYNSIPPTTYRNGVFQTGEAYSHTNMGVPLYMTFVRVREGWEYIGLKHELSDYGTY